MPRGHLVIRVMEASGKNKSESKVVWDANFIEGFVRAELRTAEGKKTNVQTQPKRVLANQISWDEELRLEITDASKELRLMLCREKRTGTRVGTSVISACGIFIKDILEAVPLNKYFELFKPGAAGEGGFIRVGIDYEDHTRKKSQANGAPSPTRSDQQLQEFYTQVSLDPEEAGPAAAPPGGRRATPRPPSTSAAALDAGGSKDTGAPPASYADAVKRPPSSHPARGPDSAGQSKSKGGPALKVGLLLVVAGAAAFFLQQKKKEREEDEARDATKGLFGRKK